MASVAEVVPASLRTQRKTGSFYRPELDVLRFFAFLLVFVHHMLPHTPSFYRAITGNIYLQRLLADGATSFGFGLSLFFVLSAYLIATLLIREKRVTGDVHVRSFYVRRALRIWPLYALAVLISFAIAHSGSVHARVAAYAPYVLLLGNVPGIFGSAGVGTAFPIGHLWSISVEEQFYLLFPGAAKRGGKKFLKVLSVCLIAGMMCGLAYASIMHQPDEIIWRNSFVQFGMFAFGIVAAIYFSDHPLPRFNRAGRLGAFACALALCFAAQHFCRIKEASASFFCLTLGYLLVGTGCSLFLIAVLGEHDWLPRPLIYLGKISYGLYVFHAFGFGAAEFVLKRLTVVHFNSIQFMAMKDTIAFSLTLLLAILSYTVLEKPFLRWKESFALVRSRPA